MSAKAPFEIGFQACWPHQKSTVSGIRLVWALCGHVGFRDFSHGSQRGLPCRLEDSGVRGHMGHMGIILRADWMHAGALRWVRLHCLPLCSKVGCLRLHFA